MQESHTSFTAGQHVVVRDERWTVLHVEAFGTTRLLHLRGVDDRNRDELQAVLAPFDTIVGATQSTRMRHRSRRRTLAFAAAGVADAVPWDACWTAARARIELRGWQLEPARAAVTGTMRLLLADAVGLGKTIQAALIISELMARGLADRVLILTPASIRQQWARELSERFLLTPVVLDQPALASTTASLPPDANPWKAAAVIVSSIDLVKRSEVRAALDAAAFDVVVVDEAHHLTPGTDRAAVAADLAARVPWVVLATATPHSGDETAYDYLTSLGEAGDAIRVFRRSRAGDRAGRRSRNLLVTPTVDECALLDGTLVYARSLARTHRAGARLVGSVIARRAASSSMAAARTLARRADLLAGLAPADRQPQLPWEDADPASDEVADDLLAFRGLADVHRELAWLRQLKDLAHKASRQSSKVAVLRRFLRRTREQLLIFSEFRDVVLSVASALGDLTTIGVIHGALPSRDRLHAVQAFNTGVVRTLVATDAAGEGLNLHLRCRLVVNVELPWTPLRLEQRIGRVDRIGQTRRVHAIHLVHRGSYEGTVIRRLERRRARAAVADRGTESASDDVHALVSTQRRLHEWAAAGRTVDRSAVYSSQLKRRVDTVVLLFVTPLLTASGALVETHASALRVTVAPTRRLRRSLLRHLTRHDKVRAALAADIARHVERASTRVDIVARRLITRFSALLDGLDRRARVAAWQGSLFDGRVEQAAHRRAADHDALRAHLARRAENADKLQHLHAGESQLVAAWLSDS